MGGSKCTYRNCTMRSGNIHMFHYPVYDKKRCHQWLANAEKFEFLNLKLSQLRNRIVCQHHFKDECFMNYLKDRLTHKAVPTEDGPFCEPSQNDSETKTAANFYSHIVNDTEADEKYLKHHKSSVIYADYLTNGDIWEKNSLNETIWNNKVKTDKTNSPKVESKIIDVPIKDVSLEKAQITLHNTWPENNTSKAIEFEVPILPDINTENYRILAPPRKNILPKNNLNNDIIKINKIVTNNYKIDKDFNNLLDTRKPIDTSSKQEFDIVPMNKDLNDLIINQENNNMIANLNDFNLSTGVLIEQMNDHKWPHNQNTIMITENDKNIISIKEIPYSKISTTNEFLVQRPHVQIESTTNQCDLKQEYKSNTDRNQVQHSRDHKVETKKPKIRILFEEQITEPFKIPDKLEPLSPSTIINIPKKKEKRSILLNNENNANVSINKPVKSTHPVVEATKSIVKHVKPGLKNNKTIKSDEKIIEIIPKVPILKPKISPERIAAIEKKRNFNKKLRDIIEICLEKLDEQDKSNEVNTITSSIQEKQADNGQNKSKQNLGSYLSEQTGLPNVHEYTMKFIEARMQKMESVLLNKIDQNSQKIVELRKCIDTKRPRPSKSSSTQTSLNEEVYKKQLYQEMSKFLSPDANSLVYEELFMSKFGQKISKEPSPKRRKRR